MNTICRSFGVVLKCTNSERMYTSATILGRKVSFKSDLSIDKIYPKSRLQLYTPQPPASDGEKFSGFIPINKLQIAYSRSSGPGGQHVNTVNTKVDIRFKLSEADWIPEKTREKLLNALHNKLTKDGEYVIKSDLTRSQQMNLADALEKLRTIIRKYEYEAPVTSEETIEKIRKRQENAARERLFVKRQRSQVKADRQGPSGVVL